ncbi:YbhB/YbcL family Raf kinase inhibitor-like protein [Lactiplantibacillus plantarum]|uniref:YbhB/YbcL family Raf kinase inhibitor-like protein n=1 Tax=Lactiplantibacillus plantarum TaxID=1590 RepID=UPI001BA7B34B|nr:YbhB/YbcL family Raf kinase inhibitor-like protein [Lactiplantibacillus plantarum]MBS0937723.1 YbhB/YbcL family Raf kinase inhibitor-like protein [Lactiplantibacillus plantarum]MBS0945802.1 YbhB/YbcL family Raf kinase inhibitor-like protein [Lactiplantibacillus plantarum]
MKVSIPTIDGFLNEKYTKYAAPTGKYQGYPIVSFPVIITDVPKNAKSLAFTFLDQDAIPVRGFTMIHWTAANIPVNITYLPENMSQKSNEQIIQGSNSTAGSFINEHDKKISQHYFGPCPPDCVHRYRFRLYSLDRLLAISQGYYLNEFYDAIKEHVINTATTIVKARD